MQEGIPITITVNRRVYRPVVTAGTTLLSLLRDQLNLTGTKEGCGEGDCGACSILYNGKVINACLMLAVEADGGEVLTIEGLAEDGELHPLQQAFLDYGAVQCGFCSPGMILTAYSLLQENPNPTEEEIRQALRGNLCRCTGYVKIVEAVKSRVKRNSLER